MNAWETVTTEQLNWNSQTRTLSGEVSSVLGILTSQFVTVESSSTGDVRIFELMKTHRDREAEITHWTFEARSDPSLKLVLFND